MTALQQTKVDPTTLGNPAAGTVFIYVDDNDGRVKVKDENGNISAMPKTQSIPVGQVLAAGSPHAIAHNLGVVPNIIQACLVNAGVWSPAPTITYTADNANIYVTASADTANVVINLTAF